jgi:hypothetical protein
MVNAYFASVLVDENETGINVRAEYFPATFGEWTKRRPRAVSLFFSAGC